MKKSFKIDNLSMGLRFDRWIKNNIGKIPQSLIEKSIRRIIDTPFAYFFNLGNFFLIPRARIAPCNRPTAKTMANV